MPVISDAFAQAIAQTLVNAGHSDTEILDLSPVGGGCINRAMLLETATARYFLKRNSADRLAMFQAEAAGLEAMVASATFRVPAVVGFGVADQESYLLLEYLPLQPLCGGEQALAGQALAQMHRHCGERYGWPEDNFIGTTPQRNPWCDDWWSFYIQRRLEPQMGWLAEKGHDLSGALALLKSRLPAWFRDYRPEPSLLHGDLWGGNIAGFHGQPVVFDPASYYGDRETDIAMTELFGGFTPAFYQAYEQAWPLDPGYARRKPLYQLYHVLNHANLFGGCYVDQAERLFDTCGAA